ncbi:MAG: hypothetical protein ACI8S6_004249 [Myxococcota bacterium]|jgi:hypothetical protein
MYRTLSLTLGMAMLASSAHGAGFEAKTMRAPMSGREVERGLVLGKGWVEISLANDFKRAVGYWSGSGEARDFDDASWLYTTQSVLGRYGITQRGELFWMAETHYVQLTNDALDTDIGQFGIGDPEFGYTFEVFNSLSTSVVTYGRYKAPLGNESPGNYIGGPNTFSAVVMTTGTPDITVGIGAKRQLGPAAVTLDGGYIYRASGLPMYAIETDNNQFQVRVKPGNIVQLRGELLLQLGPLALMGAGHYQQRETTRIGNTSPGLLPSRNLESVAGSDGWSFDAQAGAIANVTRGVDLVYTATIPVRGEDFQFFPIEDIHPSRGTTHSGAFKFRY